MSLPLIFVINLYLLEFGKQLHYTMRLVGLLDSVPHLLIWSLAIFWLLFRILNEEVPYITSNFKYPLFFYSFGLHFLNLVLICLLTPIKLHFISLFFKKCYDLTTPFSFFSFLLSVTVHKRLHKIISRILLSSSCNTNYARIFGPSSICDKISSYIKMEALYIHTKKSCHRQICCK